MKIQVMQMQTASGAIAKNQFLIKTIKEVYFQSYSAIIVQITYRKRKRVVTLDEKYWEYSVTTSKYRNQFLGESTQETRRKIASGEYKLANLN